MNKREVLQETARVHRANLQKILERRLQAARSRGDDRLVRQLEAEANYLG